MSQLSPDDVLLGLLAAAPSYGYQLLEVFGAPEQLGGVWKLSTSQLYNILKRLERDGFIQGHTVETHDAPPRTEYQPTEVGLRRMEAWLHHSAPSASLRRVRTEFLSRLHIARLLGVPLQPIIERQRQACIQRQRALVTQRESVPAGVGALSLDLLIEEIAVVIEWIGRCETLLNSEENP